SKFPYVNFKLENIIDVSTVDVIVILDTNNLDQVGVTNDFDLINLNKPFIFIDHHLNLQKNYKENITNLNIIEDSYSSSAEIIYEMLECFDLILDVPSKFLLVAAILVDSGFLQHGDNKTILRVSKLLNEQVEYQEIISMLKIKEDISERIAKIKGFQRVALIQEKNWLIGITHVGSYEANVAASLLKIGFDIGIVCSTKKTEYRISIRANKEICLKTGLHLGKILKEISEEIGSNGGGHNGAASLTGKNGINVAKDKIIEKIKQVLNK
ncbi:MAG TPA: DHHA1 domain-containing protein, partial [Candidatus Lokiarchaeia archaeon]